VQDADSQDSTFPLVGQNQGLQIFVPKSVSFFKTPVEPPLLFLERIMHGSGTDCTVPQRKKWQVTYYNLKWQVTS
jgi:hypothetical protein